MHDDEKLIHPHEMATAHVIIKCQIGYEKQVIENLGNIEGIENINKTIGAYDVLVKLVSLDYDSLKRIIRWKIQKIDHIESVTTLLCMRRSLCVTLE
jgi:DNA-binding Lrp family transcriptional regulator